MRYKNRKRISKTSLGKKDPTRNNEALDCRVYLHALRRVFMDWIACPITNGDDWRKPWALIRKKPTRGVELPLPENGEDKPKSEKRNQKRTKPRFQQRKTVKADDPYL